MKWLVSLVMAMIWTSGSAAAEAQHFAELPAQEGSVRVYLYREHLVMGMVAKPARRRSLFYQGGCVALETATALSSDLVSPPNQS